ncbi:MAG TPA: class I adenylate-forming enzyme family protein [Acidimicrobiales bacterium]|nr:class I adenylate-forming enzyme family protein [Acidimicrobiales bacterium]
MAQVQGVRRRSGPRLRPTLVPAGAARYRRAGGPWDRGALDASFRAGPGPAVVDGAGRLDAAAVRHGVAALAGRLGAAGVRRGDALAWQLPNGAAALLLYRACWRLGAVAAPLHHRMGAAEVGAALDQVRPVLVVAGAGTPAAEVRGALVVAGGTGPGDLLEWLAPAPAMAARDCPARPADVAVALFTSGSTGVPKAALHTHRSLGYKAALMVAVHGLGPGDAVLMPAPLAHVSGLLNGVLIPAAAGIPTVLMAAWDPDEALRRIEGEGVSFMGAPPIFFSQMAGAAGFRRERVRSLRLVSTGGASVSPAFVDATAEAFGCRVKRTYGSTEAPTVTTSGPDDGPGRARDTDGRAVGEVELEVRDPDSAVRLGPGAVGELWLRGPELFAGYADPAATAAVLSSRGRWYRSGDLGVLDEQGWLRVVGRLSDIIIRAGENISASEVEAVLEAHPAVRHAVAVAVPDPEVGERVAAFVEATAPFDLDTCRSWFAARGVTRYKTPEIVVRLDALPVLAAGKPDRKALRTLAADLARRP